MPASGEGVHAVVGLGAVGRAVIGELLARGLPVRAVARRRALDLPSAIDVVAADVTDPADASRATAGAAAVYHAASAPYDRWPELLPALMRGVIAAAQAAGARLVYADNLYAYGPADMPLHEDLPYRARGPNGRVRAALADELMAAHAQGRVRATIGRASDYYGPWGRQSHAGERLFAPALRGRPALIIGNPDVPHTYTYLGDFAHGLVTLGTRVEALGRVWHVPSAETLTTREFVRLVFEAAAQPVRLRALPAALLALLALGSPMLRAVREQSYQLRRPFVVDHSKFAGAFGVEVTPHPEAIRTTLAWFARDAAGRR